MRTERSCANKSRGVPLPTCMRHPSPKTPEIEHWPPLPAAAAGRRAPGVACKRKAGYVGQRGFTTEVLQARGAAPKRRTSAPMRGERIRLQPGDWESRCVIRCSGIQAPQQLVDATHLDITSEQHDGDNDTCKPRGHGKPSERLCKVKCIPTCQPNKRSTQLARTFPQPHSANTHAGA